MGYPVTSPYGPRDIGDGFHDGTDYGTPVGVLLRAPFTARVESWDSPAYGWVLDLEGDRFAVRLAHLSRRAVSEGVVSQGVIIAQTGGAKGHPGAGNSTGAHLHVELRLRGKLIDPESRPDIIRLLWENDMTEAERRLLNQISKAMTKYKVSAYDIARAASEFDQHKTNHAQYVVDVKVTDAG